MHTCQYCGTMLPDRAVFCGECGQEQTTVAQSSPHAAFYPPQRLDTGKQPAAQISHPGIAAFGSDQSYISSPGIMHVGGGPPTQPVFHHSNINSYPNNQRPLILTQQHAVMPPPGYMDQPDVQYVRYPPKKQRRARGGCLTVVTIFTLILVIVISVIGAGMLMFKPSLTINTTGPVTLGGHFQIHGSSFIPGDTVILSLDHTTPLYYSHQAPPSLLAAHSHPPGQSAMLSAATRPYTTGSNTVTVGSDSMFDVTIVVGNDWRVGLHTLVASEGLSLRSASVALTVYDPGQTPVTTPTPTPLPSVSPTSTTTGTQTPGAIGLSSVIPASVNLGPLPAGANQTISTQVTLRTTGTMLLNWTATWNQSQTPWLQLDMQSGEIQAPAIQTLMVSAQAGTLPAGRYTTTITFSSPQNSQSITLNVLFTIQNTCTAVSPTTLNFTAVAGQNNPAPQNLLVSACGQTQTWSTTITGSNTDWLNVTPSNGNLNPGETQTINVSASILTTGLTAGTYQATLLFSSGTNQTTIPVTLTVLAATSNAPAQ